MATTTSNYAWSKPEPFSATDEDLWGYILNSTIDDIDAEIKTATADRSMADFILSRPTLKDYGETASNPSSAVNALTLDITNGNHFYTTLTENVTTLTLSNPSPTGKVCAITVELTQGGSGSYTVTWPASVVWEGGTTPILTTTVGKTDVVVLRTRDAGTTWRAAIFGQNYA